ncbi:MAG TPA: AsmA-like C-terminal region-containing protein [Acetobacteraceae bacterium]|nr:AsmA-like C-terminal region-containing protein [Acetobacteraceae bacterium]
MRFHQHAARGAGLVLHRLAHIALGTAVIGSVLLAAAAWRLSQGPVDLAWLTHRLEAAANTSGAPIRLSVGSTALVWEGFRLGVDRPLDLRLTNIRLTAADGVQRVDLPRAEVSLSLTALLLGRVQPRALELDAPRFTLLRAEDGSLSMYFGGPEQAAPRTATKRPLDESVSALLGLLARPPATDTTTGPGWYRQLQRVMIRNAVVTVIDRPLGLTWQAPDANISLIRHPKGGIEGEIDLTLALGSQRARLTGTATVSPGAGSTRLNARLSPIAPAALARATPRLGFLAMIDAPVSAEATADFGPALDLRSGRLALQAGPGTVHIGGGSVPIAGAALTASGTPDDITLDAARAMLQPDPKQPPSVISATGTIQRGRGQVQADLTIGLDQLNFADLPMLWPTGIARDARAWIVANMTGGIARDGQVSIGLAANSDFSDLTLTRATGTLQGTNLTVSWLRPVPPIVQGQAVLRIIDPDTMRIDVKSGRQFLPGGGLAVTSGSMLIAGLMQREQVADIRAQIAGTLPDVVTLLREPRLGLLARHPIALNNPTGSVTATISASVPLDADVQIDDIAIRVAAHVEKAGLAGFVGGRDLSDGALDIAASNDGLTVKGAARLAGIPADLQGAMDFRAGPPAQVVQRVTVSGRTTATQLAAAGLDATDLLSGPIGLQVLMTEQRDGTGSVAVAADLSDATLTVSPLDWHRVLGTNARATAQILLRQDTLAGIDGIAVAGNGVMLRGSARCENGRVAAVRLDRMMLGRTDVAGTVSFPTSPHGPIAVRLHGPSIDLSARLQQPKSGQHPRQPEPPPGPPWTLDGRFDQVVMAHGYLVAPLRIQAENDGRVFRRLSVEGDTGAKGPFALHITPAGSQRRLTLTAAQAGDLLRALDVTDTMQGGSLTVIGTYDDTAPGHPLRGTAMLSDFRVAHDAALGKLLQAMTLYGLRDALSGPGLAFSRMIAPFTWSDGTLTLNDARAFSPSLGLTSKGQLDLDANSIAMQGTIVPAYFFNSLLGNVPLIGRLFSPERGGGVFAASYSLRGKLDDPSVRVNPLTALTPGFLRGLFGIF